MVALNQNQMACDCCGSYQHAQIAKKRNWKIRRCSNCGLFFVFPQPSNKQLKKIYAESSGYYATANSDLSKTLSSSALHLYRLLSENGIERGRLLDVGCSTGSLIYHMKQLGWQVAGIDVNPDAVQIALQNNLDVFLGDLEQCQYEKGFFDVINMGDVIEHVKSPSRTLSIAHGLLRKGGILIINTPNANCGFAVSSLLLTKIFKFPWPHSEAPYHLYEFTPHTLSKTLENTGFEILSLDYGGSRSFIYTIGGTGFFDKLKVSMKRNGRYRINRRFFINIPKLFYISSLLLPFHLWGRLLDLLKHEGPKIFVITRKL